MSMPATAPAATGQAKTCPKDGDAIRTRRDPMADGDEYCPTCDRQALAAKAEGLIIRANDVCGP